MKEGRLELIMITSTSTSQMQSAQLLQIVLKLHKVLCWALFMQQNLKLSSYVGHDFDLKIYIFFGID